MHEAPWPTKGLPDEEDRVVEVVVQVNGKRRGAVQLAPDAPEAEAVAAATALAPVAAALGGAAPARVVYVPGRIVNLVAAQGH